jgi:hypothetical protein
MLYQHYVDCCAGLGIPEARIGLDKMLAADYLIANYDRHYNNFGAVRNADTLEWLGPAPLFDNGSSLWCNQAAAAIRGGERAKSQPFFAAREEQIKLVKDFSWLSFDALRGLDEEVGELLRGMPRFDAERRDAICLALRERAGMLLDYAESCGKAAFPG